MDTVILLARDVAASQLLRQQRRVEADPPLPPEVVVAPMNLAHLLGLSAREVLKRGPLNVVRKTSKTQHTRHSFVVSSHSALLLIDVCRSTAGPGTREDF